MRFALLILAVVVAAAAGWVFHGEMQRQRSRADLLEESLAASRNVTIQVPGDGEDLGSDEVQQRLAERVRFLENELQVTRDRARDISAFLENSSKALRAERTRHNKEIWEAKQFMPEGVRQALLALNACLRHDGQDGLRFMRAKSIKDSVLRGVELLDHDLGTLRTTLYMAGEVTIHLDRATSKLTMVLKDGFRRTVAGRYEFPTVGEKLVLPLVDGALWEERLPYLVQGEGAYPRPVAEVAEPEMAASSRASWRGRINELLRLSQTGTRYKIYRFRALTDGHFVDAVLLGYNAAKVLTSSVEAGRLAVHVDDEQQTVELHLQVGVVRKAASETAIPSSGYRIQLPGIKPEQAVKVMVGMVIRK
ncbi:MAG: hypothetical protein VX951_09680 [Planctomycetota bacterium]|nr:hypothetical protein [Planctomycetota bacterium]